MSSHDQPFSDRASTASLAVAAAPATAALTVSAAKRPSGYRASALTAMSSKPGR
jgi:hypothetical protein